MKGRAGEGSLRGNPHESLQLGLPAIPPGYQVIGSLSRRRRLVAVERGGREFVVTEAPRASPQAQAMLGMMHHDHVDAAVDVFEGSAADSVVIVAPFYGGGTVHELLTRERVAANNCAHLLLGLLSAWESLVQHGWAHAHVTTDSVFLTTSGVPVLAELGALVALSELEYRRGWANVVAVADELDAALGRASGQTSTAFGTCVRAGVGSPSELHRIAYAISTVAAPVRVSHMRVRRASELVARLHEAHEAGETVSEPIADSHAITELGAEDGWVAQSVSGVRHLLRRSDELLDAWQKRRARAQAIRTATRIVRPRAINPTTVGVLLAAAITTVAIWLLS